MAQSALTVTPPNPTPPTNLVNTGSTPPNPATFDPTVYVSATDDQHYPRLNLAPYYDDGIANTPAPFGNMSLNEGGGVNGTTAPAPLTVTAFAAKKAALAVGGTSVDHEGLGTEVIVTQTYSAAIVVPVATKHFSCMGNYTNTPNASHASSLSGTATPTLSGATGANNVSGVGTTVLTATGTNFNRASVVSISGVPQPTNYVSATSLTVTNALKRTTAGTLPVTVTSNGQTTASVNWTLT
jgi:hypothetical protein